MQGRLRPPDKFPPLLKAASLEMKVPGGNWHGYQLWSTFTTVIYEKKQAMTFLLSVRSYLELLPPKLFLLQMSISPSWRKFMSDRWSKLNKETQALYAQGNHMRRQDASNFCWQFSHFFLLVLKYFFPHWAGHHQTLNNVLHHKWRSCHDSCYGGDSHRALLNYTYHKDTAMRRYALINAAPSNQFDSPSTMVLPTILTTLVKMFWKKWCH